MISAKVGHALDPVILKIYRFFLGSRTISPNVISVVGTFFGFLSAVLIALRLLVPGAVALLVSGFFDLLDGALARDAGKVTRFGGFLDSVLDRYSDLLVMGGILVLFARYDNHTYALATFVAAIGTAIIPYARARAEAASFSCRAGLLERPERIALLAVGLLFSALLGYIIMILAVLTHVTVIQRILHVKRLAREQTEGRE